MYIFTYFVFPLGKITGFCVLCYLISFPLCTWQVVLFWHFAIWLPHDDWRFDKPPWLDDWFAPSPINDGWWWEPGASPSQLLMGFFHTEILLLYNISDWWGNIKVRYLICLWDGFSKFWYLTETNLKCDFLKWLNEFEKEDKIAKFGNRLNRKSRLKWLSVLEPGVHYKGLLK